MSVYVKRRGRILFCQKNTKLSVAPRTSPFTRRYCRQGTATDGVSDTINTAEQLTDVRIARNTNNPERDRTSYGNLVKEKSKKN